MAVDHATSGGFSLDGTHAEAVTALLDALDVQPAPGVDLSNPDGPASVQILGPRRVYTLPVVPIRTPTAPNTYGTEIASVLIGKQIDDDGWEHYAWTVTLTREGQSMTVPYRLGVGHEQTKCGRPKPSVAGRYRPAMPCQHSRCESAGWQPAPPTLYDVLTSLKGDVTHGATFADWCDDFGISTDSIKARRLYFACQESEDRSRRFFGADWSSLLDDDDYV